MLIDHQTPIRRRFPRKRTMPEGRKFRDLIQRVRARDEDAARELAEKYEAVIRRIVRIHLRDARMRRTMESMDVCQSVLKSFFVRTALGQYDLDTPEQLIGLLTAMTRNKLANQVNRARAQRRDLGRNVSLGESGFQVAGRQSDPSDQAAAKELVALVCDRLGDHERFLAEQRGLGRTWGELAEQLGESDEALRKRFSRSVDRVIADLGLDD